MQNESFSTTKGLARTVTILLFAGIGIDTVNIFINAVQLVFFPQMGTNEILSTGEMFLGLLALAFAAFSFFVFIATVVTFLIWLHRSYKNLYAFERTPQASPGWAVGYWFIPFINLFKPLSIVNEVWHASDPELMDTDFSYPDTSSPPLHIGWWLIWIFGNILSNISTRIVFTSTDNEVQNIGTMLVIVALALTIAAAYLLIRIVGNITRRQEESGGRLAVQAPPLPPTFSAPPTL